MACKNNEKLVYISSQTSQNLKLKEIQNFLLSQGSNLSKQNITWKIFFFFFPKNITVRLGNVSLVAFHGPVSMHKKGHQLQRP